MSDVVTGFEQAIKILKGAGIKVDINSKTQTWTFGRIYSQKVINAGKFLDKYNIEKDGQYKTNWLNKQDKIASWSVGFGIK